MTATDKTSQLETLRAQAKDLQARLGFLTLQRDSAETEIQKIKTVLEYQEGQFNTLQQTPVEEAPEAPKAE